MAIKDQKVPVLVPVYIEPTATPTHRHADTVNYISFKVYYRKWDILLKIKSKKKEKGSGNP